MRRKQALCGVVSEVPVRPDECHRWDGLMAEDRHLGFKQFAGRHLEHVAQWCGRWVALLRWEAGALELAEGILGPVAVPGTHYLASNWTPTDHTKALIRHNGRRAGVRAGRGACARHGRQGTSATASGLRGWRIQSRSQTNEGTLLEDE